jgi:hypothetical protein
MQLHDSVGRGLARVRVNELVGGSHLRCLITHYWVNLRVDDCADLRIMDGRAHLLQEEIPQ